MSREHLDVTVHKADYGTSDGAYFLAKWAVTALATFFTYSHFADGRGLTTYHDKAIFLPPLILIIFTVLFWYKDIISFRNRRRKQGRSWKWYKDSLIQEFMWLALIILIIGWVFI